MSPNDYQDPNLSDAQVSEILDGEHSRPLEIFQGKPLWPYTPGSKLLYLMAESEGDTDLFRALTFIYIHRRRTDPDMEKDLAANIVPLLWSDINLFRMKVLSSRAEMSEDDLREAIRIANKELRLESLTLILATPPEIGVPEKKSPEDITRRKRPGKSSKRRKS